MAVSSRFMLCTGPILHRTHPTLTSAEKQYTLAGGTKGFQQPSTAHEICCDRITVIRTHRVPRNIAVSRTWILLACGLFFSGIHASSQHPSEAASVSLCPLPAAYRQVSVEDERTSRAIHEPQGFPIEQQAEEISARLQQLGSRIQQNVGNGGEISTLLASDFEGTRLLTEHRATDSARFAVYNGEPPRNPVLDRHSLAREFVAFVSEFQTIRVTEFE